MTETTITVTHPVGLHARPAAVFVQTARQFKSKITIENRDRPEKKPVSISAFNLLQIGVKTGHTVVIRAEGEDEAAAIAALQKLVEDNFGE